MRKDAKWLIMVNIGDPSTAVCVHRGWHIRYDYQCILLSTALVPRTQSQVMVERTVADKQLTHNREPNQVMASAIASCPSSGSMKLKCCHLLGEIVIGNRAVGTPSWLKGVDQQPSNQISRIFFHQTSSILIHLHSQREGIWIYEIIMYT